MNCRLFAILAFFVNHHFAHLDGINQKETTIFGACFTKPRECRLCGDQGSGFESAEIQFIDADESGGDGVRERILVETCQRLTHNSDGPYQATGTPKSLDHKFITEDVPTGLIPMSALGVAAGVKTPAIDALIEIARCMTGKDFAAEARTLDRLGLSGMDAPQIRRAVDEGFS